MKCGFEGCYDEHASFYGSVQIGTNTPGKVFQVFLALCVKHWRLLAESGDEFGNLPMVAPAYVISKSSAVAVGMWPNT